MRAWIGTALMMWGCSTPGGPARPSDSDVDVDTDEPVEPLDEATLDSLTAALERWATTVPELGLEPIYDLLADYRELEAPDCPGDDGGSLGQGIHSDCTTPEGTRFFGALEVRTEDWTSTVAAWRRQVVNRYAPQIYPAWSADRLLLPEEVSPRGMQGFFRIETTDGTVMEMSGGHFDLRFDLPELQARVLRLVGEVVHPGAQPRSWVGQGLAPQLTTAWLEGEGGERLRLVDGGLEGLTGDFVGVAAAELLMAPGCQLEPTGTLAVRDARGSWYDVLLEDCDGCMPVLRGGQEVGQICPDLTPLLDPPPPLPEEPE